MLFQNWPSFWPLLVYLFKSHLGLMEVHQTLFQNRGGYILQPEEEELLVESEAEELGGKSACIGAAATRLV